MELRHVGWESIEEVKALVLGQEILVFGMENVNTIAEIEDTGSVVQPDTSVQDLSQLRYFYNLEALAIRTGQVTHDVLTGLKNIEILEVPAGRTIADLAPFTSLPYLRSLTISGRNFSACREFQSLQIYTL
ncbi:MAG: hypothetical protein FWE02_03825 [Defluviitaleaceae bacterium]|nr:hypothetical protein [Defluviitaleaceae bacterium]